MNSGRRDIDGRRQESQCSALSGEMHTTIGTQPRRDEATFLKETISSPTSSEDRESEADGVRQKGGTAFMCGWEGMRGGKHGCPVFHQEDTWIYLASILSTACLHLTGGGDQRTRCCLRCHRRRLGSHAVAPSAASRGCIRHQRPDIGTARLILRTDSRSGHVQHFVLWETSALLNRDPEHEGSHRAAPLLGTVSEGRSAGV